MGYYWGRLGREERLILALLNEDYIEAESLLANLELISFPVVFDLGGYHRILPLILKRLLDHFTPLLSEDFLHVARFLILQQMTANKLHRQELLNTSKLLTEAGFEVMLMKGISYDPEETYPRTYGDVDLLVEENKIREIVACLEEAGYEYQGSFILSREEKKDIEGQLHWNNQYQFKCPKSTQVIEVHINLFERDRIRLENLKALLDRPELFKEKRSWNEELSCYLPGTEATLMLLCLQCSLKRALYNNTFLLRHMADAAILLERGVDGDGFLRLCREGEVCYHACFSLRLYGNISGRALPEWMEKLEKELTLHERFLMKKHLKCLKNLRNSRVLRRWQYNHLAPFIIGGTLRQRLKWLWHNYVPTRVQQENRYYKFGFRKESPLIFLTYFLNPFQTAWRCFKKVFGIKRPE
ncbi:MAG: nucleotidyltransferase family protein [Spirochaetales bacterium]|nr:nucleotidyltransferase family protein [Spirochaetales bacterium]